MSRHDERFKRQLGPALQLWVTEELVTREQARRLRAYYAIDELEGSTNNRFGAVLLVLGGILVGLGLITFVAANWDAISHATRALVGLALMIALDAAGYRLWREERTNRLGAALLFAGNCLMGGNIALMAQWFQIGGSGWGLFLGWSLGVGAMAVGLRSGLLGALSCACMLGVLFNANDRLLFVFPWVFGAVFLPLAAWMDSRTLLYMTLAAFATSAFALAGDLGLVGLTLVAGLMALALWAWGTWHATRLPAEALPGRARRHGAPDLDALKQATEPGTLAVLAVLWCLEQWACHESWLSGNDDFLPSVAQIPWQNKASLLAFALAAVTAWGLATLRRHEREIHWGLGVSVAVLAVTVSLGASSQTIAYSLAPMLAMNVLLLGASLGLAWLGLARGERRWFFLGLLALTIQVFGRFVEFDSDLTTKSAVFTLWGVLMLYIGWQFERRLALKKEVA